MAVFNAEEVRTNRIIMAENSKNVVLKGGHSDDYDNPYI
jgi:hydroxymethylpyrimidine/phosphomethylpyrimidine kinase